MQLIITSLLLVGTCILFANMAGVSRYWISVPIQIWVCWVLLYLIYNVFNSVYVNHELNTNQRTIEILTTPTMMAPFFHPMTTVLTIQSQYRHVIRIPLEDQVDLDLDDNHNVHNKTIKRTAVAAIESLKQVDQSQYSIESAIADLLEFLDGSNDTIGSLELKPEKIDVAKQVIRQIDAMNCLYVTANIREREIFRLVWERINHPVNQPIVNQLKENLIKELADCNRGHGRLSLHCCEGRVTRLLQSLQECDAEDIVNLRPMWAFKEEITNQISKYREKLLKKGPDFYRQIETKLDLTDKDRTEIDKFNSCLISNLQKRFCKDYIDPGYLSQPELNDLTRVYYESLYDY
jgi:hypothetical protein